MERTYCRQCGHWHGRENCTAITTTEDDGTRRCGCIRHHQEQERAA